MNMDIDPIESLAQRFVEIRRIVLGDISKLGAADLPPAQSELLLTIEDSPTRVKDLAAAMNVTSGAITQLVDQLESHELIERFMNEDDRRVVWIRLSEAGLRRLGRIRKQYADHVKKSLTDFSRAEISELSEQLRRIIDNARYEQTEIWE
jgi:DNA-binding MarR family transcriptional regulator